MGGPGSGTVYDRPPRRGRCVKSNLHRLRSANILLIGMKALANEIAKNLVLAGIGSLTILDDQVITEEDLGSQFFISELHVGMNVWIRLWASRKGDC